MVPITKISYSLNCFLMSFTCCSNFCSFSKSHHTFDHMWTIIYASICKMGATLFILCATGLWSFALSGDNEWAVPLWHDSKDKTPIYKDKWRKAPPRLGTNSMVCSNTKVFNSSRSLTFWWPAISRYSPTSPPIILSKLNHFLSLSFFSPGFLEVKNKSYGQMH